MIHPTQKSLDIVRNLSESIHTFHHHFHILYDIANTYDPNYQLDYLEIGCYGGCSASLMLQRKNTNVTSIDIGAPISKEQVYKNIEKFNTHNNNYKYVMGDSQLESTYSQIKSLYDIIYIDGDHSYDAVIRDFHIYSSYLKNNGYIVFDDYNDYIYCKEVKPAVDFLVKNKIDEYEIIGTLKNILGARGFPDPSYIEGNCFIIRKK